MLTGIAVQLIEWAFGKGFLAAEHWLVGWAAKRKEQSALKDNLAAEQAAIKSGDDDAIKKAGENSLNNSNG